MATGHNIYEDVFLGNRLVSMQNHVGYMFAKLVEIFTYEGLPLTIPKRVLERLLTRNGWAIVYEYEGDLFVSDDAPSGKPDLYGDDTAVTIHHRVGDIDERLERQIGVDAVMLRNDTDKIGLEPMILEFSALTAQAKITMLRNLVDLRGNYIIQAKDQRSYESAMAYENAIRNGDTSVILAEEFDVMEGLVVHNTPIANNPATQTIELFQYINAYYYSELGISLNNNMKREYVSESEIQKSTGVPLITNMLACRLEGLRDIEALFDVKIDVRISEEWSDDEEEARNEEQIPGEDEAGEAGVGSEAEPEGEPEAEPETEAEEQEEAEGEPAREPDETPEAEPVAEEELIEATEALTGEEAEREVEEDSDPDDPSPEADADED